MHAPARMLLLVLCPLLATAETSPAPQLVQRMLEGQQIGVELTAIRDRAVAEIDAQQGRVRAEDRTRLAAIVQLGFHPDTLTRHVREELLAEVDLAHAEAAADWLARDGTRSLYAEGLSADARCLEDLSLEEFSSLASEERSPLVFQVATGTGVAGRSVRRGSLVFAAMLIAGNPLLPEERRFNAEQVRLLIEAQRATLASRHPTDVRALHCAYRAFSTPQLAEAADFYGSPAGRWLRAATDRAMERALIRAAEDTARYIVEAFGDTPPAAPLHTALAPSLR